MRSIISISLRRFLAIIGMTVVLFPALVTGTIVQVNSATNPSQSFYPCSATDLINGGQPTAASNQVNVTLQFGLLAALTNGALGAPNSTGTDGCGDTIAWQATFYLNTAVNTNGYTLTNLATFAGWTSDRTTQQYELYLAFQGDPAPGTFYSYGTFSLSAGGNTSTKIELTGTSGAIATNVCAIRLGFAANGAIYREVDALGFSSTTVFQPPPVPSVYVSTNGSHTLPFDTWDKAATNLQSAIDVGLNKVVLVSNGTYNLTSPLAISSNLTVRSVNGAANTIVRRASGTTALLTLNHANAVVDGLTLREGNNGCMALTAGTVQNCVIVSNTAGAGAIVMSGGIVRDSLIAHNSAGIYGSLHMTGVGLVSNCVFTGNSTANDGAAVHCVANGLVANCIITNNTANRWGGGIEVDTGASPTIRNCLIARNSSLSQGGGIAAFSGSPVIESCTIVSNSAGTGNTQYGAFGGGGLWIGYSASTLKMSNCIVYFNKASSGFNIAGTGIGGIGFSCASELAPGVNGNVAADPEFMDVSGGDWRLRPGSPCMDTGSNQLWMSNARDVAGAPRIRGGVVDLGCYETDVTSLPFICNFRAALVTGSSLQVGMTSFVSGADTNITWCGWAFTNSGAYDLEGNGLLLATNSYPDFGEYAVRLAVSNGAGNATSVVKTVRLFATNGVAYVSTNGASEWPYHSWAKAATNIQDAINVAPGLLVLVSNGTYNVTSEIFVNNGLVLQSVNGATNTTVRRASGTTRILNMNKTSGGIPITNAVVDGFTVREGNSGALTMIAGVVQNCIVISNTAASAITMDGGKVQNCSILNNSGGGYGAIYMTGAGLVSNCVIAGNSAVFDGGAAVLTATATGGQIVNCVITNNLANRWGGGVEFENVAGGVVRNCLIARNRSIFQGGGISSYGGNPLIESCTIVSNTAGSGDAGYPPLGGGGIYCYGSGPRLTNSIVYFNVAPTNANISGTCKAGYSCSPDLTAGVGGNITSDPRFMSANTSDFQLAVGSPCINSGLSLGWMTGALDLAGKPRISNGTADMGAFEYVGPTGSMYSIR